MKLNFTKKIGIEEFPGEVRGWIGKLVNPLNKFMEQAYQAFTNGLTIRDNLKGQVLSLDVLPNQTYPVKLSWSVNERPTALFIGAISQDPAGTVPVHSINWTYDSGTIEVTISGLDASKKYKITLVGLV